MVEQDIISRVYAAKEDISEADALVRQYLPFIKAETAKFLKRPPMEGQDEELGIAMFAFHETVMSYQRSKGAFLPLASTVIRNRLIDHYRKEKRHKGLLSLNQKIGDEENSPTLLEQMDSGCDNIASLQARHATREEIEDFAKQLSHYGLKLTDIADNCPKQSRTLDACQQVLKYARQNPVLLEQLISTGKLPITALAKGSGVEPKTLERHRKYLFALLLAFTNGFEIIRGHLCRMSPEKGEN